jgi:uncharacterized GH25 family protein
MQVKMINSTFRTWLVALVALACVETRPNIAFAHETWVIPVGPIPRAPASIRFDLTSGEAFPQLGTGPKSDRINKLEARSATRAWRPTIVAETPTALKLATDLKPGLTVVTVTLSPHDIDLAPDKVEEYLAEVGPDKAVLAAWQDSPSPKVWRETYVKNAKALICVGRCERDRTAMYPVGAHLEIVPVSSGSSPKRFRLLAAGRALAGRRIDVFGGGAASTHIITDRHGMFRLPPSMSGWAMVSAVWLRPPSNGRQRFESDFASLVFEGAAVH